MFFERELSQGKGEGADEQGNHQSDGDRGKHQDVIPAVYSEKGHQRRDAQYYQSSDDNADRQSERETQQGEYRATRLSVTAAHRQSEDNSEEDVDGVSGFFQNGGVFGSSP